MIRCRVLKDFPWCGCTYMAGREVTPHAEVRKQWLRRGLVEIIGEEAVEAKEKKAQAEDVAPMPKFKRKAIKKAAVV